MERDVDRRQRATGSAARAKSLLLWRSYLVQVQQAFVPLSPARFVRSSTCGPDTSCEHHCAIMAAYLISSPKVSSLGPGDDRFTTTINRHFMQLVHKPARLESARRIVNAPCQRSVRIFYRFMARRTPQSMPRILERGTSLSRRGPLHALIRPLQISSAPFQRHQRNPKYRENFNFQLLSPIIITLHRPPFRIPKNKRKFQFFWRISTNGIEWFTNQN